MANRSSDGTGRPFRVGLVGAGYIAEFHAKAIKDCEHATLVAVCDANPNIAQGFARSHGIAAYASLDEMLAKESLDAVHILAPPDLHFPLAATTLKAGVHVFLEKPMTISGEEARELVVLANAHDRHVCVNHSFLFSKAYAKLREHVRAGDLGPIDYVAINQFAELGQMRVGPFSIWMLRQPQNALIEIGPHPLSGIVDLVGAPDTVSAVVDREVTLPNGATAYRRWRIHGTAGRTAIDVNIDLGPGFGQRTIQVRGLLGSAYVDLDADTCTIDRRTSLGMDFDRYRRSASQAGQMRAGARSALGDYILSKAGVRHRGNPYETSFLHSVAAFYGQLAGVTAPDQRISGMLGADVIETCEKVIAAAGVAAPAPVPAAVAAATPAVIKSPTVLVVGGTGFIGRKLIQHLLAAGHTVRAAARGTSPVLEALGSDRLELVRADVRSRDDVDRIMDGIETVFHLATSDGKSWSDYVAREIEPARMLAEVALERGVKRFVYTGTIDSLYAGGKAGTITDATPLDRGIKRRNYYARAKAAVETILLDMHRDAGLPLVIVRPGIVIGEGGNPFHWGVGRWSSEGVVEVWGEGRNPLPLVLVDDVAAALVKAMEVPGIEGRAYNLVDAPALSARDYLAELERFAGIKVAAQFRPIWRFWLDDLSKWPVKVAVRHHDAARRPSYRDWESRTQKAAWDVSGARDDLGWTPAGTRARIVEEGIGRSIAGWLKARG